MQRSLSSLHQQIVLITGATRGIGLAAARTFIQAGATVIGTGRKQQDVENIQRQLGSRFRGEVVDFTRLNSYNHFRNWLKKQEISVLVNNAGVNKIDDIRDLTSSDWDRLLHVNLTVPAFLSSLVARGMARRGYGRIVHVGSIFGVVSRTKRDAYSAGKAGLTGLTRAMALDLATHNVLVNTVCPGFTDTELTRTILSDKEFTQLAKAVPMKRMAHPDEIAKAILFLGSPDNTYMTGQLLIVDGGFTAQ
jgi:3-oxoacyl-[acyl-carrier protein] reductase